MGVGQFSGDGSLFGAAIAATDHNYTIVLDSHTGRLVSRFGALCYGLPHRGALVRDDSTRANTFVADTADLATGQEGSVTLPDTAT